MNPKKILIIDDNPDILKGLSIRMKANGYLPVFAADAIEAVSVARKEKPDLILLDIGLPGGDGFIVMERLQNLSELSLIPIIVLSARDPAQNRERALKAGARAFFQKPVDSEELLEMIQKTLEPKTSWQ